MAYAVHVHRGVSVPGLGRIFKLLPFHKVRHTLGEYMKETPISGCTEQEQRLLRQISRAIHTMSRVTWWESQCLVKAVAAMKMLERRGLACTLYLGSGRDDHGKMVAHAHFAAARIS